MRRRRPDFPTLQEILPEGKKKEKKEEVHSIWRPLGWNRVRTIRPKNLLSIFDSHDNSGKGICQVTSEEENPGESLQSNNYSSSSRNGVDFMTGNSGRRNKKGAAATGTVPYRTIVL